MLILIAESKTMSLTEKEISHNEFNLHKPIFEDRANEIMEILSSFDTEQLSLEVGISKAYASKLHKMIYEFKNKSIGNKAIESFTGVVFKALNYKELSEGAKKRCSEEVRIISSLYGVLNPDDIVKPYRLEFTNKLSPDFTPLNNYWKKLVTIQLVKYLKEHNCSELLNLLPSDASKCIDWKLIKNFTKVWKVDFQEMKDGGELKTPSANKLKTLRGELLRQILEENVRDISTVEELKSPNYFCVGTPQYPDHLHFIVG